MNKTLPSWWTTALWISMFCVALWALAIEYGTRMPYVYTDFAWKFRLFLLFPFLLAPLIYFGMIKKQSHGETGFQKRLRTRKTTFGKLRIALLGIAGMLLVAGGLAWTSIAFPAILTNWIATERFAHVYRIESIQARSGPAWSTLFDLELYDSDPTQSVVLRLKRRLYEQNNWRLGETVCVVGRTSPFGTIIDLTTRDTHPCDASMQR